MNFARFLFAALVVLTPLFTTLAEIEVQVIEFALHGTESSPEAITSALNLPVNRMQASRLPTASPP